MAPVRFWSARRMIGDSELGGLGELANRLDELCVVFARIGSSIIDTTQIDPKVATHDEHVADYLRPRPLRWGSTGRSGRGPSSAVDRGRRCAPSGRPPAVMLSTAERLVDQYRAHAAAAGG